MHRSRSQGRPGGEQEVILFPIVGPPNRLMSSPVHIDTALDHDGDAMGHGGHLAQLARRGKETIEKRPPNGERVDGVGDAGWRAGEVSIDIDPYPPPVRGVMADARRVEPRHTCDIDQSR